MYPGFCTLCGDWCDVMCGVVWCDVVYEISISLMHGFLLCVHILYFIVKKNFITFVAFFFHFLLLLYSSLHFSISWRNLNYCRCVVVVATAHNFSDTLLVLLLLLTLCTQFFRLISRLILLIIYSFYNCNKFTILYEITASVNFKWLNLKDTWKPLFLFPFLFHFFVFVFAVTNYFSVLQDVCSLFLHQ